MRLDYLLERIEYNSFFGNSQVKFSSIAFDSRKVEANSLFVAIRGYIEDGHRYIKAAINNRATVVVCEYIPNGCENLCTYVVVNNSRKSMADIADIFYGSPSRNFDLVGVTGTNGKTSITYLIKAIADGENIKNAVIGTVANVIDNQQIKTEHSTPESVDIQRLMSCMVAKNVEIAAMEVSSHSLELNRVDRLHFDIGVFTNLTKDHLDFHHTMENYYQAKKKLFFMTSKNNIVNIDDEYGLRLYNELLKAGIKAISYGFNKSADIAASNVKTDIKGTVFDLKIFENCYRVNVKTPGSFSVENTMASLGAVYCLGYSVENAIKALENFCGVPGRFEIIKTGLDCTIILDFAHTVDGLRKIIDTVKEFTIGRKIVVLGAGGERDVMRRAPLGELVGEYFDLTVITSDNPRFENPYDICEEIADGVKKSKGQYKIIIEREKAIAYVMNNYQRNDLVLLLGKATEPYQDVGLDKIPYDERTVVENIANEIYYREKLKKNK